MSESTVPEVLALISESPLDAHAIEDFVAAPANGALVAFRGIVRDHDHGEAVDAHDSDAFVVEQAIGGREDP